MIFSCKDCPNRCLGCHDKCDTYKSEKEMYENKKRYARIGKDMDRYNRARRMSRRNDQLRKYGKSYA